MFGTATSAPTVRVVDHYPYSNVSKASALAAVVSAPVLSYADLTTGLKTVGTVKAISKSGVIVSIGPNVQALCPTVHLHDAPRKSANEREFKVRVSRSERRGFRRQLAPLFANTVLTSLSLSRRRSGTSSLAGSCTPPPPSAT